MAATATTTSSSPAAEETAAREWAWLPCNVLDSVLSHLISLQDYRRFTSVCKPWNSTAQSHIRRRIATSQNQLPLLLVPTQNRSCRRRSLYSFAANKLLINQSWLAFLGKDYFVALYNPFTKARIFLPQIIPSPDYIKTLIDRAKHDRHFAYNVRKLILSADPSISPDGDFIVAAVLGEFGTLAVMKTGEKEWKHVKKDKLYPVTGGGG
ncbi:unnamed protein product [Linum tenue]|uniref:KIB1-4 beta-propeller domain-containing protein n=1 Tax=Linum tenue TaxID=586396 RepID=A0AAV0QQY4_9ROSI|nr:unnamed protein product [Linum tenue]